ncbi:alcohol dehydrogenase catalytic domain-containing protein [Streptomyces sp. NPDC060002]|uniref:alcohol dehydrogenase catalytic domain-containing protein n=1 Tax=Streptomyces sp. NPDC060002 TaxID=3347033 RepID=UPI00368998CF
MGVGHRDPAEHDRASHRFCDGERRPERDGDEHGEDRDQGRARRCDRRDRPVRHGAGRGRAGVRRGARADPHGRRGPRPSRRRTRHRRRRRGGGRPRADDRSAPPARDGHDFAGVVETVGDRVNRLLVGDDVLGGTPITSAGAFAGVLEPPRSVDGRVGRAHPRRPRPPARPRPRRRLGDPAVPSRIAGGPARQTTTSPPASGTGSTAGPETGGEAAQVRSVEGPLLVGLAVAGPQEQLGAVGGRR